MSDSWLIIGEVYRSNPASDRWLYLVNKYNSALMIAYCYRIVGNEQDAQEVWQETQLAFWRWVKAHECFPDIPLAFLYRTARNLCISLRRKRDVKGEQVISLSEALSLTYEPTPSVDFFRLEELLEEGLATLPQTRRDAWLIWQQRENDRVSLKELAARMGVSEETFTTYRSEARKRLREFVEDRLDQVLAGS